MAAVIDRKADIELLKRLKETKADRSEINDFNSNLNLINDKLKHLSVYSSELANILIP